MKMIRLPNHRKEGKVPLSLSKCRVNTHHYKVSRCESPGAGSCLIPSVYKTARERRGDVIMTGENPTNIESNKASSRKKILPKFIGDAIGRPDPLLL